MTLHQSALLSLHARHELTHVIAVAPRECVVHVAVQRSVGSHRHLQQKQPLSHQQYEEAAAAA
jgi:hypothetical protein